MPLLPSPIKYSTNRLTKGSIDAILNHMVESKSPQLDAVFHALADPTRRSMLRTLAEQDCSIGELAAPFEMSLAAASKHVKVLERVGLLQRTVHGRTHICRLDTRPMRTGIEWMRYYEKFWGERLDVLEGRLLAEDRISSKSRKPRSKK